MSAPAGRPARGLTVLLGADGLRTTRTRDPERPEPTGDPRPPSPPPPRPGASIFTIEGRAAPALFVVGWLASILGSRVVIAGALAGSGLLVYFVGPGLLSLGLIAAAGNQAIERRARGAAYAGPSPILVFAATVAVTYFVGAILGPACSRRSSVDRHDGLAAARPAHRRGS